MNAVFAYDLVELAHAIHVGDVSAEEVTHACLNRLECQGRLYNAVVYLDTETALEEARNADLARARGDAIGLLHGIPLAHKDLFYRAGKVCAGGSRIRAGFVPDKTATVLSRLREAGAINLGALHMAEFALSPTGYNKHYGYAHNPWQPKYICGGSSSGSGVAVAGRMVFGSLGTDTGGSIRHPAAMCGITGLKPTLRRVSVAGVMPLSSSLDCVGPLAQSARDCARLLGAIAGADSRDRAAAPMAVPDYEARLNDSIRGLRIAAPRDYYDDSIDPEVRAAREESLRILRDLGAIVVETHVPDMALINAMMQVVFSSEAATIHRRWLVERPQDYSEQVRERIEPGLFYPATRYIEALSLRTKLTKVYLSTVFGDCAVVHLPVIPITVPTIEATMAGSSVDISRITRFTRAINYLGLPALSVPAGFSLNGLPIGIQLVGKPFDEETILQVGNALQKVTDWHRRIPHNSLH